LEGDEAVSQRVSELQREGKAAAFHQVVQTAHEYPEAAAKANDVHKGEEKEKGKQEDKDDKG
jgi:hypothetical protein